MHKYHDIYFLPKWGQLYAQRDNGKYENFYFKSEYGTVYYQFVKRNIETLVDGKMYYDIITPYGFNGPIVIDCIEEASKKKLIQQFETSFNEFCLNNNIIAEYIRFNPWIKNHLDFEDIYEICPNKFTIGMNLEVENIFMDEISSKRRNLIRKSINNGIKLEYDFSGETIEEFLRLYKMTIEKNNISDYYIFDIEFLKKHFESISGNIFMINGIYKDEYISSAMFIHYGDYIHYHFSANNPNYYWCNANSYILLEAAEWGKKNGKKQLHLGGASSSNELAKFKKSFTKQEPYEFFVGKKIRNQHIYDKLCYMNPNSKSNYFPLYRG